MGIAILLVDLLQTRRDLRTSEETHEEYWMSCRSYSSRTTAFTRTLALVMKEAEASGHLGTSLPPPSSAHEII